MSKELQRPDSSEIDLTYKFIELDTKRIEIAKARQDNISRQYEYHAKTAGDAKEVALKDIESNNVKSNNNFKARSLVIWTSFIVVMTLIIGFGIIIHNYADKNYIIDKLFSFLFDIGKVLIGGVAGYGVFSNRKHKQ